MSAASSRAQRQAASVNALIRGGSTQTSLNYIPLIRCGSVADLLWRQQSQNVDAVKFSNSRVLREIALILGDTRIFVKHRKGKPPCEKKISLMRAVVLDTVPACDRHGRTDTGLAEHREGSKTDRGVG